MPSLVRTADLTASDVDRLFLATQTFMAKRTAQAATCEPNIVYLIFDQPSTRTRESFRIAASRIGCDATEWHLHQSRVVSGALIEDELRTLVHFGASLFVIRSNTIASAAKSLPICIINAG